MLVGSAHSTVYGRKPPELLTRQFAKQKFKPMIDPSFPSGPGRRNDPGRWGSGASEMAPAADLAFVPNCAPPGPSDIPDTASGALRPKAEATQGSRGFQGRECTLQYSQHTGHTVNLAKVSNFIQRRLKVRLRHLMTNDYNLRPSLVLANLHDRLQTHLVATKT